MLTCGEQDDISPAVHQLRLLRLNNEILESQLFYLHKDFYGGLVLKSPDALRSFRSANSLKMGRYEDGLKSPRIYVKKQQVGNHNTFKIISDSLCLVPVTSMYYKDMFYLKFDTCKDADEEFWGVFTAEKARAALGVISDLDDADNATVQLVLDDLDKQGRAFIH